MEMPATIAVHMPLMQRRAKATETDRLKLLVKTMSRNFAWLITEEIAQLLAMEEELRARKHSGRRKKEGKAV